MRGSMLVAIVAGLLGLAPMGARRHTIFLRGDPARDDYRMQPAHLRVSPGDTLSFHVQGGAPHAIAMSAAGLEPRVHEAWNRALPHRVGDLRGPLLRGNDTYLVVVPRGIPEGTYRLFCQTHRAYDSAVELTVE